MLLSEHPPTEDIQDLLVFVRDFLSNGAIRATDPGGTNLSDLDAAVRWFGARLDDLVGRTT